MSAPRRWKDAPDAPIGVRELLASAAPRTALGDRAFARGAARVSGLGVAPAAIAVSTAIWVKVAAAGAVVLVAAGAVVALEVERREPDPRRSAVETAMTSPPASSYAAPAPVPVPEPPASEAADEPRPPVLVPPPAIVAAPTRAAAPAPSPPAASSILALPVAPPAVETPAPSSSPSTLPDELALLDHAKKSLARDPETTLRDVAAHRARYPHGNLAPERDLLELDALRHAGRLDEARRRAHVWLDRDPAGLHSARVRAILDALEAR